MGLFGDSDASDIPDNPFYVAPDTYLCMLTEAGTAASRDGSKHGVVFKWKIMDEDSEYFENSISDWNTFYPDGFEALSPEIKRNLSNLKSRLTSMGVSEETMNDPEYDEWLPELVGTEAYVTVKETADKNDPNKKYTNITNISLDV